MMRLISTLLLLCLVSTGCATTATPPRPARINHLAFFKLQEPADTAELIDDCDRYLAPIPGIVSYYAGTHLDVGRSSVTADYDVGFYVGFETESDYLAYVEHPDHVHVVTKWKPRLQRLKVYDVVDE